jgi:hypothetical protein
MDTMKVRQSPLPYLFIFWTLSSVIVQDASSQETTTGLNTQNLLSYVLNERHFFGSWQSTSSAQPVILTRNVLDNLTFSSASLKGILARLSLGPIRIVSLDLK